MLENFDEVYVANHEWKHLQEPFLSDFLTIRRNYEKSLTDLIEIWHTKKRTKEYQSLCGRINHIIPQFGDSSFGKENKKNVSQQVLEDEMVSHLLTGIEN
jgi:hypothetical protein